MVTYVPSKISDINQLSTQLAKRVIIQPALVSTLENAVDSLEKLLFQEISMLLNEYRCRITTNNFYSWH